MADPFLVHMLCKRADLVDYFPVCWESVTLRKLSRFKEYCKLETSLYRRTNKKQLHIKKKRKNITCFH